MRMITQSIQQFTDAVTKGETVSIDSAGRWKVDNFFITLFKRLISFGVPLIVPVALQFIKILDQLEETPIKFGAPQTLDFTSYLLASEALLRRLNLSMDSTAIRAKNKLLRRIIALRYRLEPENGGEGPELSEPATFTQILNLAAKWKKDQDILYCKELNSLDHEKLAEAARYKLFAERLLHDQDLCNLFFAYLLRDHLESDFFIQFPALHEKLLSSSLQGRIGRMGGEFLKIVKVNISQEDLISNSISQEKNVTLPFEGTPHNILNPLTEVHLRGNYNLTINEVFEIFKNKYREVGNLEFLAEGISNWNAHKLGWWDDRRKKFELLSLIKKDWWKVLPLFEVISKEEARKRYGNHLNGTSWSAAATATRGAATLDYDNSHAYLELIMPRGGDRYAIYDFGKTATKFPTTFLESVGMFCHTVIATVAYPDENVFYTHRQHSQHSIPLNQRQGHQILELIRLDLIKARAGNFVYQIESENCAKWLHEKLEAVVGKLHNIFTMKLLNTEPIGFVRWIFDGIKILPESWQVPVLMFFHYLLGAYQKTIIFENNSYIVKSLSKHTFWKTGEVFLPAFLHQQRQIGVLTLVAALEVIGRWRQKKIGYYSRNCNVFIAESFLLLLTHAGRNLIILLFPDIPENTVNSIFINNSVEALRSIVPHDSLKYTEKRLL